MACVENCDCDLAYVSASLYRNKKYLALKKESLSAVAVSSQYLSALSYSSWLTPKSISETGHSTADEPSFNGIGCFPHRPPTLYQSHLDCGLYVDQMFPSSSIIPPKYDLKRSVSDINLYFS